MRQDIPSRSGVFPRLRLSLALAVVVLAAALLAYVGVTRWWAAQTAASAPTIASTLLQPMSVHIVRVPGNTPTAPIVPLDRTLTDVRQVQHLYQTTLNLPNRFLTDGACMGDPEDYLLTFSRDSQVLLTVRVHTGLCWDVELYRGDSPTIVPRRATRAFWAELAQVLGLPLAEVEPLI
jgi:hypothetical protein